MFRTNTINILLLFTFLLSVINVVNCESADSIENDNVSEAGLTEDEIVYRKARTEYGKIRGVQETTLFKGYKYYAFRGIPFAKPPLADLRFLPPQKPESWDDILDTIDFKNMCTQIRMGSTKVEGDEDCLYVNVYTPDPGLKLKLPVMFYIHGGAFTEGSGNNEFYGPDFLIEQQIVLVTVQYRLSPFGFMNLGTPKYSGNMGLKDQLMALQWTRDNIRKFGGDPEMITVFGHSAGSIITHLNTIVPTAQKLFQRAILQSGVAFTNYLVDDVDTNHREMMMNYAKSKGVTVKNDDELIAFLNKADAYDLYAKTHYNTVEVDPGQRISTLIFKPVVECDDAEEPFLTDLPENLLANNKHNLSIMIGYASNEYMFVAAQEAHNPAILEPFNEKFQIELPHRDFQFDFDSDEYLEMAEKIREFYFGDKPIDGETFYEYLDLLSDTMLFGYSINKAVLANVEHSSGKTFYYRFSVDSSLNLLKLMLNLSHLNGTTHADELCYIFTCKIFEEKYKALDKFAIERQIIDTMVFFWANFARVGDPTPDHIPTEWKTVTADKLNFMEISNDGCFLAENPNGRAIAFWDQLFEDYAHFKKVKSSDSESNSNKLYDEL